MISGLPQQHPDAELARDPVPPELIDSTPLWIEAPPNPSTGDLTIAR